MLSLLRIWSFLCLSASLIAAQSHAQFLSKVSYADAEVKKSTDFLANPMGNFLSSAKSTEPDCFGFSPVKNLSLISMLANSSNVATHRMTCGKDASGFLAHRFSKAGCEYAISCRKMIGQKEPKARGADVVLNRVIANDYGKKVLLRDAALMEKLEMLKLFSQKKFSAVMGSTCSPRFAHSTDARECNSKMLTEVVAQHHTTSLDGDERDNFAAFKDKEVVNKSRPLINYFNHKMASKLQLVADRDEAYLDELATLVTSDSFRSATSEKKAELFLKKVNSDHIDPVLGYEFQKNAVDSNRLRTLASFKQLVKIYEGSHASKDDFKKSFDDYRRKTAQTVVLGNDCANVQTLNQICKEMTALELDKKVKKDSFVLDSISSKMTRNEEYLKELRSYLGDNFAEEDFETLVNAKRCISFDIFNEKFSGNAERSVARNAEDVWSAGASVNNSRSPSSGAIVTSSKALNSSSDSPSTYIGEKESKNSESASVGSITTKKTSVDNSTAKNLGDSFNSMYSPTTFPNVVDETPGIANSEVKKEDASHAANSNSSVIGANSNVVSTISTTAKVNDNSAAEQIEKLTKELNAAEKKLEKVKSDADKKAMDDLRAQIAELKNENAVSKAARVSTNSNTRDNSESRNYNNSFSNNILPISTARSDSPSKIQVKNAVPENYVPTTKISPIAGASGVASGISQSKNSVMPAILTGSSNNSTSGGGEAPRLRIDGMTLAKASMTIISRINELKGVPFYIEENGEVKEVLPVIDEEGKVVKDKEGNPVFTVIVRGKVNDKKFAKGQRAPASISDLNRDEVSKIKAVIDRAKFSDLQGVTKGAIEKKD